MTLDTSRLLATLNMDTFDDVTHLPTDLTERELDDLLEAYDQAQEAREDTAADHGDPDAPEAAVA